MCLTIGNNTQRVPPARKKVYLIFQAIPTDTDHAFGFSGLCPIGAIYNSQHSRIPLGHGLVH